MAPRLGLGLTFRSGKREENEEKETTSGMGLGCARRRKKTMMDIVSC